MDVPAKPGSNHNINGEDITPGGLKNAAAHSAIEIAHDRCFHQLSNHGSAKAWCGGRTASSHRPKEEVFILESCDIPINRMAMSRWDASAVRRATTPQASVTFMCVCLDSPSWTQVGISSRNFSLEYLFTLRSSPPVLRESIQRGFSP